MTLTDTTFDFQAEAGLNSKGEERDFDRYSPTLQEYHRLLWSKPLPTGEKLRATIKDENIYEHYS